MASVRVPIVASRMPPGGPSSVCLRWNTSSRPFASARNDSVGKSRLPSSTTSSAPNSHQVSANVNRSCQRSDASASAASNKLREHLKAKSGSPSRRIQSMSTRESTGVPTRDACKSSQFAPPQRNSPDSETGMISNGQYQPKQYDKNSNKFSFIDDRNAQSSMQKRVSSSNALSNCPNVEQLRQTDVDMDSVMNKSGGRDVQSRNHSEYKQEPWFIEPLPTKARPAGRCRSARGVDAHRYYEFDRRAGKQIVQPFAFSGGSLEKVHNQDMRIGRATRQNPPSTTRRAEKQTIGNIARPDENREPQLSSRRHPTTNLNNDQQDNSFLNQVRPRSAYTESSCGASKPASTECDSLPLGVEWSTYRPSLHT